MQCGMRLTLLVPTTNLCSFCPIVPEVPFYKAALQSVHLQQVQDFSLVLAELGETPGNAFLQPLSLWATALPSGISTPSLKAGIIQESADSASSPISSEDTKLHLSQNLSLRRTATSNQLWDGLCTANHNLSGLKFQPVFHSLYNLLILSISHYFDWYDTIKDLGKISVKVKANIIHYSSLIHRISPPHNDQSVNRSIRFIRGNLLMVNSSC